MKSVNPQGDESDGKRSFGRSLMTFIVLFVISDLLITRPLVKRFAKNNKKETDISVGSEVGVRGDEVEEYDSTEVKIVSLENEYVKLNINTRGLLLNDLILKKYKKGVDDDENVKLLTEENHISLGWLSYGGDLKVPTKNSVWTSAKSEGKIAFVFDNKEGIIFEITLSLDEKYMLNVEQTVKNNMNERVYLKPFWQVEQNQKTNNRSDVTNISSGIGLFNNKLEGIKIKKLKGNNVESENFGWAGITSKYWLISIINENISDGKVNFLRIDDVVKIQYTTKNNLIVLKNSSATTRNRMFVGAKNLDILKEYREKDGIRLFDRNIDFGFFYFLSKPLYLILGFLNKLTHNFGIAIILLTVFIKLLLYPTVKKSFVSMAKMKRMQPELKRVQEKYANDRVKTQQELVRLYKKYEVNPMSGIIPIFIQIPVFFSLYRVISISIDMRQAPFIGYIKDLSSGDPTTIFNLFGLLPFHVGFRVGLLPCLMALTMYIQQKTTENMQQDDTSMSSQMRDVNRTTKYLPLIFLLMFSNFPSGLLLYWIFNNIITIIQQKYMSKTLDTLPKSNEI